MVNSALRRSLETLTVIGCLVTMMLLYHTWSGDVYSGRIPQQLTGHEAVTSNSDRFLQELKESLSKEDKELLERDVNHHRQSVQIQVNHKAEGKVTPMELIPNLKHSDRHVISEPKRGRVDILKNWFETSDKSTRIEEEEIASPDVKQGISKLAIKPIHPGFEPWNRVQLPVRNQPPEKGLDVQRAEQHQPPPAHIQNDTRAVYVERGDNRTDTGKWERLLMGKSHVFTGMNLRSLFYRMNLVREERRALSGGPHEGLPNYKSTCWPSRISLNNATNRLDLYSTNPYKRSRCINGGKGQDHCALDFYRLEQMILPMRFHRGWATATNSTATPESVHLAAMVERLRARGVSEEKIADLKEMVERRARAHHGVDTRSHVRSAGSGDYRRPIVKPDVWYDTPWRLRCLPYVYLAGVTKSGTTDLYDKLIEHPDIEEPSMKEPMFFDRNRLQKLGTSRRSSLIGRPRVGGLMNRTSHSTTRNLFPRRGRDVDNYFKQRPRSPYGSHVDNVARFTDFSHYLDLFDHAASTIETYPDKSSHSYQKITLDGTPCYLWDYDGWQNIPGNKGLDEPKYTLAHTLAAVNPRARIIFILREPSERLLSHFRKTRSEAGSPITTFHAVVKKGVAMFKECMNLRTPRACAYDVRSTNEIDDHLFLRASIYSVFIKDFLEVFPRDQVLVLRGEDYYKDRKKTLARVFEFLGLSPMEDRVIDTLLQEGAKNQHIGGYKPMLPVTKHLLTSFFRPFNEELADLLRDDSFLWNDS